MMREQEFVQRWGKQQMSMCRLIAGLVGFAFVAAAAIAVVCIGAEVRAAPLVAKESTPEVLASDGWACAQEPWPYGCQWRNPSVKRVFIRPSRPS
jgi:hypothetical protein